MTHFRLKSLCSDSLHAGSSSFFQLREGNFEHCIHFVNMFAYPLFFIAAESVCNTSFVTLLVCWCADLILASSQPWLSMRMLGRLNGHCSLRFVSLILFYSVFLFHLCTVRLLSQEVSVFSWGYACAEPFAACVDGHHAPLLVYFVFSSYLCERSLDWEGRVFMVSVRGTHCTVVLLSLRVLLCHCMLFLRHDTVLLCYSDTVLSCFFREACVCDRELVL